MRVPLTLHTGTAQQHHHAAPEGSPVLGGRLSTAGRTAIPVRPPGALHLPIEEPGPLSTSGTCRRAVVVQIEDPSRVGLHAEVVTTDSPRPPLGRRRRVCWLHVASHAPSTAVVVPLVQHLNHPVHLTAPGEPGRTAWHLLQCRWPVELDLYGLADESERLHEYTHLRLGSPEPRGSRAQRWSPASHYSKAPGTGQLRRLARLCQTPASCRPHLLRTRLLLARETTPRYNPAAGTTPPIPPEGNHATVDHGFVPFTR